MSLTGKGWRNGAADFLTGIADVDALATALKNGTITPAQFARIAAAVLNTRAIATTAPLTGGGDLSADRTFAISPASAISAGSLSAANFSNLSNVPVGALLLAQPYVTASFNLLTAAGTFQDFNTPTAAGKRFVVFGTSVLVMTARDAAFTGNLVAQLGQNGTTIAGATQNITSASVNTIASPIAQPQQVALPQGTNSVIDTSVHPLQINIVTAPTGPAVCTGFFVVNGVYI